MGEVPVSVYWDIGIVQYFQKMVFFLFFRVCVFSVDLFGLVQYSTQHDEDFFFSDTSLPETQELLNGHRTQENSAQPD